MYLCEQVAVPVIVCVCVCIYICIPVVYFHIQNLPEDEVLRHGKEAVEAHFKSKFKEVCLSVRLYTCSFYKNMIQSICPLPPSFPPFTYTPPPLPPSTHTHKFARTLPPGGLSETQVRNDPGPHSTRVWSTMGEC